MAYTGILKDLPQDALCTTGQVDNVDVQYKYASSTVVSTAYVDIWPNASILSYLASAETMNVTSTSTADDEGLTGLEKLTIEGIDGSYNIVSEEVILNGTANVLTSNSYLRVYRMRGTQSNNGANDAFNVGTVTATASSAATVQSYMTIGTANTTQSQYTVPDAKYMVLTSLQMTVQNNDQANFRLFAREDGEIFTLRQEYNIISNSISVPYTPPLLFLMPL